ncbi:hypothetical protein [uncultured Flavobacterium sp.]|uniref:hypothetical protein n=1 Tax=uncultured Flavobacterium sp. TaxID=165435 RepID=UPI0030CA4AE1
MGKKLVLIVLFILPLVVYMFFATGVNNFVNLPILTKNISELPNWKSLNNTKVKLKENITILGFLGNDVLTEKGNLFNLNQKIYNKNKEFKDFQIVMIAPNGTEKNIQSIIDELGTISDLSGWKFVFTSLDSIAFFHKKLKIQEVLDPSIGSTNVYIIDKDLNLRGRKGKDLKGENEYKEGYNTISAADLHNNMSDDVKVILAEYRLALKRNNKRKI